MMDGTLIQIEPIMTQKEYAVSNATNHFFSYERYFFFAQSSQQTWKEIQAMGGIKELRRRWREAGGLEGIKKNIERSIDHRESIQKIKKVMERREETQ